MLVPTAILYTPNKQGRLLDMAGVERGLFVPPLKPLGFVLGASALPEQLDVLAMPRVSADGDRRAVLVHFCRRCPLGGRYGTG